MNINPCACGLLRCTDDPEVKIVSPSVTWAPSFVWLHDGEHPTQSVLRTCRQCRTLYVLTQTENEALPVP